MNFAAFQHPKKNPGPSPTWRLAIGVRPSALVLGIALAYPWPALGQITSSTGQAASDAQVIDAWRAANPGGPVPQLKETQGQGTRIEWTGSASVDRYNNRITSASGYAGTPLVTGQHYRANLSGDLRAIHAQGAVDYLQFSNLHSNDPAVLFGKNHHLSTLQFGRSASGYSVALGDVAPNFSPLSSSLGLRGILGQGTLGAVSVNAYSGQVAESWESLLERDLRMVPLRSARGLKLEYPLTASTRAYATTQGYTDRPSTTPSPSFAGVSPSSSHNHSLGFAHRDGRFALNGETAVSSWEDGGLNDRHARATVVDGSWQTDKTTWRFGAHEVDPGYTSLSLMARPGISEAYVAADWAVSPAWSLGADVRRSKQATLATPFTPAFETETDAVTLGVNFNFGADWPGWSGSLQGVHSVARAADDQRQLNRSVNALINYASPTLNASVGYGRGRLENSVSPDYDSDSQQLTWALRRSLFAMDGGWRGWTGVVGLSGKAQWQEMANGSELKNGDAALQFTFERAAFGSVNLLLTAGSITPGIGYPSARSRGIQLDATYLPTKSSSVKVYWRHMRLNANYATLAVIERTAGIQLNASF